MALDLQRAANRRMRIAVLVLVGVVVLLAGMLVGVLVVGGGSDDGQAAQPSTSPSTPEDTEPEGPGYQPEETTSPGSDFVAPSEYVQLPAGEGEAEGLPVGFPQTPEGAAAAVVSSTRTGWSWDPEQVERGIRVYASEDTRADLLDMAEAGADSVRQYVGIPESGPIPEDAALNAWPIGVQWEELSDGAVRVSTLTRLSFTPGNGEPTQTHLHSTVNDAVWEGGDWKIRAVPAEVVQNAPQAADLGTQEFIDAGWVAIQEGEER